MSSYPSAPPTPPASGLPLPPVLRERLGRLKAEADLASLRVDVARSRFRAEVEAAAVAAGLKGSFELDLDRGVFIPDPEQS